MMWLIVLGALLLAGGTYVVLERLGRRAWLPGAMRAVAWLGIGVLVLNLRCPVAGDSLRPLVLLDGSLSFREDSTTWGRLRDSLAAEGEVRAFGDERPGDDLALDRGHSRLADALAAAMAVGRPVVVVTDGEVEDVGRIPEDVLRRAAVSVRPRRDSVAIALTRVDGPPRVSSGDSLLIDGELQSFSGFSGEAADVTVAVGERRLATTRVAIGAGELVPFRIAVPTASLRPGHHLLSVSLPDADTLGPPTSKRWLRLAVVGTPGVVMVASPADWDARSLYRTMREVSQLPVRGYARVVPGSWRSMEDLAPVPEARVRAAARRADVLVVKGSAPDVISGSRARGMIRWPSGEGGETQLAGDWYISTPAASPITAAFLSIPVESLPPAVTVTPVQPGDGEWVGLLAQAGRRGALRPVLIGGISGGRRVVTISADGLWRWAFGGGAGEQGYRNLVAAVTTWLLASPDTAAGLASPVRGVVERARPVLFRWQAPTTPEATAITLQSAGVSTRDTLRFDGEGLARLWLPVGEYRYALAGGGGGLVAVEPYSDEWLPRPVSLRGQEAAGDGARRFRSAREVLWLFGLIVTALAAEWLIRRRMGLR